MRKRLVFRVDDVGYTTAYDLGAYKALTEGVGSSADVMLDSPDTIEALKWLADKPWISVGWHRHLWESPVLPPEEVPSLVDEEGRFKWRHKHPELMAEATYEDAYKEFCAQAELCKKYLGRYPDVAGVRSSDIPLEKAFKDVLDKYGIVYGVFSTMNDGAPRAHFAKVLPEYEHLHYYSFNAQPDPKTGFDLAYFKDYNPLKVMTSVTWTEQEEAFFYGWHPGYCDDHIMAESRCNLHRCKELEACCSKEIKDWIIENKIELVNQYDVIHGTNTFQDHLKEINSPLWIGNMK